jgi:hypothetical protein
MRSAFAIFLGITLACSAALAQTQRSVAPPASGPSVAPPVGAPRQTPARYPVEGPTTGRPKLPKITPNSRHPYDRVAPRDVIPKTPIGVACPDEEAVPYLSIKTVSGSLGSPAPIGPGLFPLDGTLFITGQCFGAVPGHLSIYLSVDGLRENYRDNRLALVRQPISWSDSHVTYTFPAVANLPLVLADPAVLVIVIGQSSGLRGARAILTAAQYQALVNRETVTNLAVDFPQ